MLFIVIVFERMFLWRPAKWLLLCLAAGAALNGSGTNAFAAIRVETTTTLTMTSGGGPVTSVPAGSVVTLTATVKAPALAVTAGQVNFCDASAVYCTDIHIIGTAQLTSAGTAAIKFRPGIGSHSYKAVFAGANIYVGSSSGSSVLTVTGTYPSITALAQSGSPGDYSLRATVGSQANKAGLPAPTGLVSFLDSTAGNTSLATVSLSNETTGLSFFNSQTPQTGDLPWSLATADFNGDGIPDLAVANYSGGTVSILLGNGDGTFSQPAGITIGNTTFYVATGDFNGDGKPDLAVANGYYGSVVSIFLGNGDGTFAPAPGSPIVVAGPFDITEAIAVADFNGDGVLDLAAANDGEGYDPSTVTILLGKGDGTFAAAATKPTVGESPTGITTGDFNGDGTPDLATANFHNNSVTILLGNGDGMFTEAAGSPIAVGNFPWTLSTADFNRDGKADLAVANNNYEQAAPGTISVLLGTGDGTFTQAAGSPISMGHTPESAAVGDFNGDGIADLAVANNGDDTMSILLGAGDGTFTPAAVGPISVGDFPQSTVTADFTGSGISDFAVGNENDNVSVLLSILESATASVGSLSPPGPGAQQVVASYAGDSNYVSSLSNGVPLTPVVATPGISPASGTYDSVQTVTITDATPTTTVYYAASGALQTSGWVEYTGPIALPSAGRTTIQAYAIERGYQQSNFASTTYYLNLAPTAAPVISPASGVYPGAQSVTISDSTAGAVISYSINGTSPAAASQPYTGPIPVSSSETVVATATAYGYAPSPAVSAQYLIGSSATSLIYSIAGNGIYGYSGDGGPAVAAGLNYPFATAVDSAGSLYIADSSNNVVRKVAPGTGIITTFAGNGTVGYSGDHGPAASAELFYPTGVAVDRAGNVYIADRANNVVREVAAATGTITTIAGTGTPGYAGDGGPAGAAELYYPTGLATDRLGNLYIADAGNSRIREVAAQTGMISTVAGSISGGYSGDGGPATSAALYDPYGVAIDSAGNLYVADTFNHVIRKVDAVTSLISTVAGNGHGDGTYGAGGYSGDGGPAAGAELNTPFGVAVDGAGNLSIADTSNHVIRQVAAGTGIISTVVGNGAQCTSLGGDGGPATSAALCNPQSVTVDSAGNRYIASGARIRLVTAPATPPSLTAAKPAFSVAAGTYAAPQTVTVTDSTPGAAIYITLDGSTPTTAGQGYNGPINVSGNVTIQAIAVGPGYLTSPPVSASYIITSPPTAVINTVAGDGVFGFLGIGGPATSAQMGAIAGVALDGSGNLYFTDPWNQTVWQVAAQTGIASIVAGNGSAGYTGDGGPAIAATLDGPAAVAVDKAANLYIADQGSSVVRKVAASTGLITTYAGGGHGGDGGPAMDASLNAPSSVALDGAGNLYIADTNNCRVRLVSASSGVITTVAGQGTCEPSGDGGLATAAGLSEPNAVALDSAGNLYIASSNGAVRKVTAATGIMTTVAGINNESGSSGDGGLATQAQVAPRGLALDSAGNLYISDWSNVVRVVSATSGIITRFAGNGYPGYSGDGGSATVAELLNPAGIAFDASGNLYIADSGNYRVRVVSAPRAPAVIPVFSPAAGSYTGTQMVAITDGTKDATIHYTTDGSTPTTLSDVYSGPIPIAATTTLQAVAVAAGYPQSAAASAVYTIHVPSAPALTVTASSTSITTAQALTVTATVSGGSGSPTATGSVSLTSGTYGAQQNLANGATTFSLAAGVLPVGSDVLTAVYAPDASSATQYKSATDSATVTVTQASNTATATVTLTPSAATVTDEQTVNVAVSVAGAAGQATPTGTVTFGGGSYSAQHPLTAGAAGFSIPAGGLSAPTNTLTANYSGDGTYAAARGSVTITVAPVVAVASNPSPATPGSSAMATITFSAGSNYSGTLNLACALTVAPTGAQSVPTCNLNPASVTLAAGGQATTVFTAKTTASSSSSSLHRPGTQDLWHRWGGGGVIALALMFGIPGLRRRRLALPIGLCAMIAAGMIGCGGGGAPSSNVQPGTPGTTAGSYTFSVTATDASNAKPIASTNVTVNVQ